MKIPYSIQALQSIRQVVGFWCWRRLRLCWDDRQPNLHCWSWSRGESLMLPRRAMRPPPHELSTLARDPNDSKTKNKDFSLNNASLPSQGADYLSTVVANECVSLTGKRSKRLVFQVSKVEWCQTKWFACQCSQVVRSQSRRGDGPISVCDTMVPPNELMLSHDSSPTPYCITSEHILSHHWSTFTRTKGSASYIYADQVPDARTVMQMALIAFLNA